MKYILHKGACNLNKLPEKNKDSHLEFAKNYMMVDIKNTFCREVSFSLGLVIFVFVAIAPSFAMVEDDDTISQFVRYIKSSPDHNDWNIHDNNAATCVFPILLPDPTYNPQPVPNFDFCHPSKIEYDENSLYPNKIGEKIFYEGKVNGEKIRLEAKTGQERLSYPENTPDTKDIVFGAPRSPLHGNDITFRADPTLSIKSFIVWTQYYQNNTNLLDCLATIRESWKGIPTLTYEGTIREEGGAKLKMTFQGNVVHALSPTALLYTLDTIQKKIGLFVKIELPHFGFQFEYLGEEDLHPNNVIHPFPGQIYYGKSRIYQDAKEQIVTWQSPSEKWLTNWGPKLITPNAPDLWGEQLEEFNRQQRPRDASSRSLDTVLFIDPECQHPVVGEKRKIPSGRYKEPQGSVRKKAKTIYSDGMGSLSIAGRLEEKWVPADKIGSGEESYTVHTYCDTRIRWKFPEDTFVHPTKIWPSGLYRGREGLQNNQIIWEKIDSDERRFYQMNLGKAATIGMPIRPPGMMLEDFVENISYYPIKYLNLLQDNALTCQDLNKILSRMEELNEFCLKFNFENNLSNLIKNRLFNTNSPFDDFITLLDNNTIKRNLKTLELRFRECPVFGKVMSKTLGTSLAKFENLKELRLEIPYVRPYWKTPVILPLAGLVGLGGAISYDVIRLGMGISYEEHLILARKLAKSQSLKRIKFYGVGYQHDKENIEKEIHKIRKNITVTFEEK